MIYIFLIFYLPLKALELKVSFYKNRMVNTNRNFVINLEKGLYDQNISLLMKYIDILKTDEMNYLKQFKNVLYCKFLNNIDFYTYSLNFTTFEEFFQHKEFLGSPKVSNLPPIIVLYVDNVLIDLNNIVLLKIIFFISKCKKNNWKALKNIKELSKVYSSELLNFKSICRFNKLLEKLENISKLYRYLKKIKIKKYKSTIKIVKDLILCYLNDTESLPECEKKFQELNKDNIFFCEKKVNDILNNIYCEEIYYCLLNKKEQILFNYLK